MKTINRHTNEISENRLPLYIWLLAMTKDKEQIRNKEYRYLLNATARAEAEMLFQDVVKSYKEHFDVYEKTLVSDKNEQQILDSAKIYFEQYLLLHQQIVGIYKPKQIGQCQ